MVLSLNKFDDFLDMNPPSVRCLMGFPSDTSCIEYLGTILCGWLWISRQNFLVKDLSQNFSLYRVFTPDPAILLIAGSKMMSVQFCKKVQSSPGCGIMIHVHLLGSLSIPFTIAVTIITAFLVNCLHICLDISSNRGTFPRLEIRNCSRSSSGFVILITGALLSMSSTFV